MRRLKKILIVDDDQELVRTWRNAFSLEGVESDAAYSGQEALSVLRGKGPGYYQAALLDIWMETPTAGLDVFPEITRTDQNLPVIFVSTHVTEEWLSKMVLQGAALMVPKPVPFEVVFQTVLSAAIRRDLEQENWRAHEDQVRSEEKAKREQQLRFYIQLITHHVKNLAFGAKARLHAAMEEMKEKDLKEQLDVVKTLLDTISKQVGRILVMHKVSGDQRASVGTLVDQALFTASMRSAASKGEFRPPAVEVPSGLPDVSINEDVLADVLTELLTNALRSMQETGGRIHISACTEEAAGKPFVTVRIRDEGVGVPEGLRGNLFEIKVSDDEHSISGFGLPFCHEVINTNSGEIWYEPASDGNGSVFAFRLPAAPKEQ